MFKENELYGLLAKNGLTKRDFAKLLGINATTLYKKIKRDGDFSRKEIQIMINQFGKEEICSIFF